MITQKKKKYILALDQGTTSSRAIIFDSDGAPVSSAQKEFTQYFPGPGLVEHDPMEIWAAQISVAQEALLRIGLNYHDLAAIGVANQRETTVVWNAKTGKPVYNAIVWQCRRTSDYCKSLKESGFEPLFKERTGLVLDPYFSGTKLRWILDNIPGAREEAESGELLFGTVDTWLVWNLTGGKVHVTDVSNASRTLLFNIHTLKWDEELSRILDIPQAMLPEVRASSCVYGETDADVFGAAIPIAGIAGDQQSSLFGHACFSGGDVKNTYGTGCFMLMNTGDKPVLSDSGLLTTIAWKIGEKTVYALEGSVFTAGAAVQWLRDEVGLIEKASDSERLATMVEDTCGVYLVPAFTGLAAPNWNPYARGVITGLTRSSNKYHIVRAALESIAYQSHDLLVAMQKDTGMKIKSLKADWGASANDFLMQFQADILNTSVLRPVYTEATALGAAYLAGLAVGFWKQTDELAEGRKPDRTFEPSIDEAKRGGLIDGWKNAVGAALKPLSGEAPD